MKTNIFIFIITFILILNSTTAQIPTLIKKNQSNQSIQFGLNEAIDIRYNFEKQISKNSSFNFIGVLANGFNYSSGGLNSSNNETLNTLIVPLVKLEYKYYFSRMKNFDNSFSGWYIGQNVTLRTDNIISNANFNIISGSYSSTTIGIQRKNNRNKMFNFFLEYRSFDFTNDASKIDYSKFRLGVFWGLSLN